MKTKSPVILSLFIFFLVFCSVAYPQKLPKIQELSVRAPVKIKVDGKLNEWNNVFYAKNTINDINYTISNDDNMLYLTVRALSALCGSKIVNGGVTFMISHELEKKAREKATQNVSVTFPLVNRIKASSINQKHNYYWTQLASKKNQNIKEIDSLYRVLSIQTGQVFKEIKVTGIKGFDTISVYNTIDIKAAAGFDSTFTYVYELAIPLKYLGLRIDNATPISYNIKLNVPPKPNPNEVIVNEAGSIIMRAPPGHFGAIDVQPSVPTGDGVYLMSPTGFWGEYVLAKVQE